MTDIVENINSGYDERLSELTGQEEALRELQSKREAVRRQRELALQSQELQVQNLQEARREKRDGMQNVEAPHNRADERGHPGHPGQGEQSEGVLSANMRNRINPPDTMVGQGFQAINDGIYKGGLATLDIGIMGLNMMRDKPLRSFTDIAKDKRLYPENSGGYALLEAISQFGVGWAAAGRKAITDGAHLLPYLQKLKDSPNKLNRFAAGMYQGAVADFLAFPGNEGNLSNIVQSVPELHNPVTAFLAHEGDDSELEGRIKNTLEGGIIGGAVEKGLGALGKAWRGNKQTELLGERVALAREAVGEFMGKLRWVRAMGDLGRNINADGTLDEAGLAATERGEIAEEVPPAFGVRTAGDNREYYQSDSGEYDIAEVKIGGKDEALYLSREAFEETRSQAPLLPYRYIPQYVRRTVENPERVSELADGRLLYVREYVAGDPHYVVVGRREKSTDYEILETGYGMTPAADSGKGSKVIYESAASVKGSKGSKGGHVGEESGGRLRAVQIISRRLEKVKALEDEIIKRTAGDTKEQQVKSLLQNHLRRLQDHRSQMERLLRGMARTDADAMPLLTPEESARLDADWGRIKAEMGELEKSKGANSKKSGAAAKEQQKEKQEAREESGEESGQEARSEAEFSGDEARTARIDEDGDIAQEPYMDGELPKFEERQADKSVDEIAEHITPAMRKAAAGDIDALALMESVARQIERGLDGRGKGISNEQVAAQAKSLGETPEAWRKLNEKAGRSAAEMYAMDVMLKSATKMLVKESRILTAKATKEGAGAITEADKLRYRKAQALHIAVQEINMNMRSAYGRTLQIMKAHKEPTAEAYRALRAARRHQDEDGIAGDDLGDSLDAILDEARAVQGIAGLSETDIAHHLSKLRRDPRLWDYLMEWRYFAMLSGWETHAVNITSNFSQFALHATESALAGVVSPFVKGADNRVSDGMAVAVGGAKGMPEALSSSWEAFKLNRTTGRYSSGTGYLDNPTNYTRGAFGALVSLPGRALNAEDEFFKAVNYNGELQKLLRVAARRQKDMKPNEFTRRFWDTSDNGADMVRIRGELALKAAKVAERNTFTSPIENTFVRWLQGQSYHYPFFKLFIPFIRTPFNLLEQGVLRTPYAPLVHYTPGLKNVDFLQMRKYREAMEEGGNAKAEAQARVMFGSILLAMSYTWASGDAVTGSDAPGLQKLARDMEGNPYSVRIGNKNLEFDRIESAGFIMAMGMNLKRISALWANDDDATVGGLLQAYVLGIAEYLRNKTVWSSVDDLIEVFNDPDGSLGKAGLSQVQSFIPAAFKQGQKLAGDLAVYDVRETMHDSGWMDWLDSLGQGLLDKAGAGGPGNLTKARDFFGKERKVSGGLQRGLRIGNVPKRTKSEKAVFAFFRDNDWIPGDPSRDFTFDGISVDLSSQDYNKILAIRGAEIKDGQGLSFSHSLAALVESAAFKGAGIDKQKLLVSNRVSQFTEAAKGIYFKNNPRLRKKYESAIMEYKLKLLRAKQGGRALQGGAQ